MRVTLRHTFDFREDVKTIGSDLVAPRAWDAARETVGPFGLPDSREEWERAARQPQLERRAEDIVTVVRALGGSSICSHGVGTGMLELNIHRRAPDVALICTDYAPRATERLARLFPEAEVVVHDLAVTAPPSAGLHLMHRIDTEMDAATWMQVLARFYEPILLVPVLLLGVESALKEMYVRIMRPRASRAGWVRTEDALRALWVATHEDEPLTVGDQRAFLLRRRER